MARLRALTFLTAALVVGLLASALAAGTPPMATTPVQTTPTPVDPLPVLGCVAKGDEVRHHATRSAKVVALTFDDGPSAYTPQVLKVLRANHVAGTFFVIGRNIAGRGKDLRQEIEDGDAIGNHTYDHVRLDKLSLTSAQSELTRNQDLIAQATGGYTPCLFRPPNGAFNGQVEGIGRDLGMLAVIWNDNPQDYLRPGATKIYERLINGAKPGGILLMHEGGGNRSETVAALPRVIKTLKARGYRFKTVPDLLGLAPVLP